MLSFDNVCISSATLFPKTSLSPVTVHVNLLATLSEVALNRHQNILLAQISADISLLYLLLVVRAEKSIIADCWRNQLDWFE